MYAIIDNLYLASYQDVQNNAENVAHCFVINCSKDLPMMHDNSIRLPVNDDLSPEAMITMQTQLPQLVLLIENKLANHIPVVVHCHAGRQRSAAVVCAYIMWKTNSSLEDSINFVKSKKTDAFFWQANFRPALEYFNNTFCN